MADEQTPPAWQIIRIVDDKVKLILADRDGDREIDLGPFEEACDRLAAFLAQVDFGDHTPHEDPTHH